MRIGPRLVMFLLLIMSVPVASYFFVFQPRNVQIYQARAEIKEKQAKLARLAQATRSIDDLGAEIDKLSSAIDMFEQKLPAEREVEVMLEQVWQLATRHQLVPESIRTDKPIRTTQYAELPIRMEITGDFDGFYSFLLDLEKLRRITRLPKMKLDKVKGEEGMMRASMTLSIFFDAQAGADQDGKDQL